MSINIHTTGTPISASTTTATAALAQSSAKYIRVVNGTTSLAYVNAGATGVTATSANIAVAPNGTEIFERDPNVDVAVAVLLVTGTGIVSFSPCAQATYGA